MSVHIEYTCQGANLLSFSSFRLSLGDQEKATAIPQTYYLGREESAMNPSRGGDELDQHYASDDFDEDEEGQEEGEGDEGGNDDSEEQQSGALSGLLSHQDRLALYDIILSGNVPPSNSNNIRSPAARRHHHQSQQHQQQLKHRRARALPEWDHQEDDNALVHRHDREPNLGFSHKRGEQRQTPEIRIVQADGMRVRNSSEEAQHMMIDATHPAHPPQIPPGQKGSNLTFTR